MVETTGQRRFRVSTRALMSLLRVCPLARSRRLDRSSSSDASDAGEGDGCNRAQAVERARE